MMKFVTILAALIVAITGTPVQEEVADFSGHQVIAVTPLTEGHIAYLAGLQAEFNLDVWNDVFKIEQEHLIRIPPYLHFLIKERLDKAGIKHAVAITNLQKLIEDERQYIAPEQTRYEGASKAPSLQLDKYHPLTNIHNYIKDLESTYPHVASMSIGKSYEGRDILGVKIASGKGKPVIFFECGIHAREWISTAFCNYFINELATKYGSDDRITKLVDTYEWQIFPSVNPDGYVYTHTSNRMWRKTRSLNKGTTCRGADGNRNFDVSTFCGVGTSKNPCDEIYCGAAPFSEKETQAIRDAILSQKDRIEYYFSFHSYGQLFMFPYSYTTKKAANHADLLKRSTAGAAALYKVHNTKYQVGPIATTIYAVTGSTLDWAYDKAGVQKTFVLELRPGRWDGGNGFVLSADKIIPTSEETFEGILATIA